MGNGVTSRAADERVVLDPDAIRARELQDAALEADELEDGELTRVIDEIRSSGAVRLIVMRTLPDIPGKKGYVGEMTPGEFTYESLRKRFGPGRYRIRCMGPRGLVPGGGTVDVAEMPVGELEREQQHSAPQVETYFERMRAEAAAERERSRAERNDLLKILLPAAAPIIAALIGRQGPDLAGLITALKPAPAPTMPEMMEGLAKLKALAPEQTTDPLDRALKLLDVIADKAPSGGESGWIDLAREAIKAVAPSIAPMIEAKLSQSGAMPALNAPVSSTVPVAAQITARGVSSNLEDAPVLGLMHLIPWLQEQMTMALQKAERASDPEFIAERILDDLPERVDLAQLLGFIERPDWFQQLSRLDARVHQHVTWFEIMRVALIRGLREELNMPPANTADVRMTARVSPAPPEAQEIDRPSGEPPSLRPTEPKA